MKSALRAHWPLLAIFFVECVVLRAWLRPGDLMGSDWIRRSPEELAAFFPWPHVWNGAQQIGENTSVYMTSFPLFSFMGLLERLHVPWTTIERLCYFFPYLVLSAVAPYALAYRLTRNSAASALCALYFSFNPWMVQSIERGAIPSIVAASIIPLAILQLLRLLEKPAAGKSAALAAIIFSILLYDIRYAIISSLIVLAVAVEELLRKRSAAYSFAILAQAALTGITLVIFNLYWLVPQFISAANPGGGYGSLEDYRLVSGAFTPAHALANVEPYYHWVASNPAFEKLPPDVAFFVIPILVLGALAVSWKRRYAWSFALTACAAAILSSGSSGTFASLNTFVYTHVPLMQLFRDVNKWMSATTLAYGLLLAYGAARAAAWLRARCGTHASAVRRIAFGATVVLYVLLMRDAFNPIRYRLFSTYAVASDTRRLEQFLQTQPGYARTLVFPRDVESMRAGETHPYIEAQSLFQNPMYGGARFLNYDMTSTTTAYENPLTASLLRELNVRYIVVPYDDDKIVYKPQLSGIEFGDAVSFISHQPYVHFVRRFGRNFVFELNRPMLDRGFIAPLPFVYNGSGLSLAAVAPTPLWNARPAAIFVDQPLPAAIARFAPAYIEAPFLADTNLTGARALAALAASVRSHRATARRAGGPRAIAATSASSTTRLYTAASSGTVDAVFDNGLVRAPQTMYSMLTVPTATKRRTFRAITAPGELQFADARLAGASWNDRVFVTAIKTGGALEVRVYNPNMQRASGTLLLQGVRFAGRPPHAIRCDCTGESATADTIDSAKSFATVVLRNITLSPGTTTERLQAAGLERAQFPAEGSFVAAARTPEFPPALTGVTLMRSHVSLAENPFVTITGYRAPGSTLPSLLLTFESITGGPKLVFERKLSEADALRSLDLRALVGTYQHAQFSADLTAHAADAAWLREHRLRDEPDGAGVYELTQIDAVAGTPAQVPLRGARLWVAGSLTTRPESSGAFTGAEDAPTLSGSALASVRAEGLRAVRVRRAGTLTRVAARPGTGPPRLTLRYDLKRAVTGPLVSLTFFAPDRYSARVVFIAGARRLAFDEAVRSRPAKHGITPGLWPLMTAEPNVTVFANRVRCLPDPCGAGEKTQPAWRRFTLDTTVLEDADAAIVRTATRIEVSFGQSQPGVENAPEFAAILAPDERPAAGSPLDGMTVNGEPPVVRQVLQGVAAPYIAVTARVPAYATQEHTERIQTAPVEPYQPKTALIANGLPTHLRRAEVLENVRLDSPTEVEGTLKTAGGIFVFTEAFDPAWRLASLPPGARTSGWALADYVRFGNLFGQDHSHIAINDLMNGWALPRGSYHLLLLFSSQVFSELGALLTLCLTPIWMIILLAPGRKRRAESGASLLPPPSSSSLA